MKTLITLALGAAAGAAACLAVLAIAVPQDLGAAGAAAEDAAYADLFGKDAR